MNGIIIKAISSFYYVDCGNTVYECKARGNFRKTGVSPVVGDMVEITSTDDSHGVIEKIFDRKNCLARPIVANIDKLIIVSSYECPSPDLIMIDRLIANAVYYSITPIIVFNKSDTGDFSEYKKIYENSGFQTFVVSAKTKEGIDALRDAISSDVCAFAGNSGVGKSSLINTIFDGFSLATGEVSTKLGRGRHTTRHTELFSNGIGGYIVDTPGFSSFENDKKDYNFKLKLADCFPEFYDYKDLCKFTSCTHTCEKGCAVIEAMNNGKIEKSRHHSYVQIFEEYKDLKEWEK